MPEIQNPEIVRNIEKRYGLRGYPAPGSLAPEIVPVSIVDDISGQEELDLHPFQGTATQAGGGAGTYASACLYNPAGSGKIVAVKKVLFSVSTTGWVNSRVNVTGSLTTNVTTKGPIDVRSSVEPVALVKKEALGAQITAEFFHPATSGVMYILDDYGWILDEDTSIYIQNNTANDAFYANFIWTERPRTVEDDNIP